MLGAAILVVACVIVALAAHEALARAGERRASITIASAVAVLAVLPALLGRPFDSLHAGLGLTVVVALPLAILGGRRVLRGGQIEEPLDAWATLAMLLVVVLGAWVSWSTRLWDGALGHWGFASEIARGVLPPEHPLFPGSPLRYHVGYDVLVALVVAGTGLSVDPACELVATLTLALLVVLLRDAGRALGGARHGRLTGALAVLVVPLGYGAFAMCLADGWGAPVGCQAWFPSSWVSAPRLPPPVISNFFQHPQGTAMPIALAALLVACERPSTFGTLVAAVLLSLLSQVQIVFFACTGLGVGSAVVIQGLAKGRVVDAVLRAALLLLALVPALAGGLLAGGDAMEQMKLGTRYFDDEGVRLVARHLALFGLTLLAVPLALRFIREDAAWLRVALVVAAAASFLVPNIATYARSWDIVKFFAVGSFFANLLLADLLARARARAGRAALVVLLVLSTSSGALWLVRHGPLNGVIAFGYALPPPSPLARAVFERWSTDIGPRDRVLTNHPEIWQLGFHIAGADWRARDAHGHLVDRARADELRAHGQRALRSLARADLDAVGASWLLLSDKDIAALPPQVREALDDRARFEDKGSVKSGARTYSLFRVVRAP